MIHRSAIISACLLLALSWSTGLENTARAERVRQSDLDSSLEPGCESCWHPSPNEPSPDRLPTFKSHRPRRLPDSRPHRYPKGRYKLGPEHKQLRLSSLRM